MLFQGAHGDAQGAPCRLIHQHIGHRQLPDAAGELSDAECASWLGEHGINPVGELRFYERKHIFTHIEWHMRVCATDVSAKTLPSGWVLLDESHALPTAYRVCL